MVPDASTAASGGSLLYYQYRPFAILKPKNRKKVRDLSFDACFSHLEPKPPSGGQTKNRKTEAHRHLREAAKAKGAKANAVRTRIPEAKVPWLARTLLRSKVFDHDRREDGCGSSTNSKGNCASRKRVASGTSTRSLSPWQNPERLAKPRRSEAQERES
jgi:hypothetical protein